MKTRAANVRRIPKSERWDADRILGIRAFPWSLDGSDNAFDIQIGMERPLEMVPHSPGEVLMKHKVTRTYLRSADFEQWGLSEGTLELPGATASSQRSMSEEDRSLVERRLVWIRPIGCG